MVGPMRLDKQVTIATSSPHDGQEAEEAVEGLGNLPVTGLASTRDTLYTLELVGEKPLVLLFTEH